MVETELATERVAKQTAETNAAVQTALVTERTARLNEAQVSQAEGRREPGRCAEGAGEGQG